MHPQSNMCSVAGCEKHAHSHGMCPMHYQRWKRTGDVDPARPPRTYGPYVAPPPRILVQPTILTCQECESPFQVKLSRAASGNARFCSRACSDAARTHPRKSLEDRFWEKVDKTSSPFGCHMWTGTKGKGGYGQIGAGGKHAPVLRAHVVGWVLANGPVPEGMCVCHSCDVFYPKGDITYRMCVLHLFLGTHQDNMDDMKAKGRDNRIGRAPSASSIKLL